MSRVTKILPFAALALMGVACEQDDELALDGTTVAESGELEVDGRWPLPASNSLDIAVADMQGVHEGYPRGIYDNGNPALSWVSYPRLSYGNDMPKDWSAFITWGQVYADRSGITAENTRFQVRSLVGWYLSKKTGRWRQLQGTNEFTSANYAEDFQNDLSVEADVREEPSGGISSTVAEGYNYHFFARRRVDIDPDDIAGIWTTFQARLVLDDPNGIDDRDQAHLIANVGADYWLNKTAGWDQWKTNGDVGIGKFKYITKTWRSFNMHTLTEEQFRNNPPPQFRR